VNLSLGELAVRFGLTLNGDPDLKVNRVATLSNARDGSLSFLANTRYRRQLEVTQATAVVLTEADAGHCKVAALIDSNPYLAYARIAVLLYPPSAVEPGIHPSAVVAAGARVAASASIGPLCVIEDDADIGERARIGAGCIVQ
jgi:UDP-3-O-[3-hydroxymyristoyl] glucosamine N-acyltransferase